MKNIFTIWKKELKDTLRDRRTLMAMIVIPLLLMPLLMIGMFRLIEYEVEKTEESVGKVAVVNYQKAPELFELIKKEDKLELVTVSGDLKEAVKKEKIELGIIIPENFQEKMKTQKTAEIETLQHSLNMKSEVALGRIMAIVSQYNNTVLQKRFADQKVDPSILSGVTVNPEDVATKEEKGGFGLGFLLPLFIVMWSTVGGQYTAIDISAGEKERKTLEALLLTPISRLEIVLGKFLAVSTAALTSVLISLGSFYAAFIVFGPNILGDLTQAQESAAEGLGFTFSLNFQGFLIILLVSLLLVLMFSALLLAVAIFAKSYKEAQSYISPLYLVIILPVSLINSIPGFKPGLWFFALPAVNAVSLFKEILVGTYDIGHIFLTIISLFAYSSISILIAAIIYSKETILFRQ